MEEIKIERLKNVLDSLSNVVAMPEEKKQQTIDRFSKMSDKEAITELAKAAYNLFGNNEEVYNYSLELIRTINPDLCPPLDDMKNRLSKMFSNEVEGNMPFEENHKLINETIVKVTQLFNEYDIDYYLAGALPCFIKTNQPLFRYHDDIDIMINEEDIPKVVEVMDLIGYEFHDDRFPSLERYEEMEENKPPHTVLAQNPDNEFHLGFFTFQREIDNSITVREYSHHLENGEVAVDVLERRSDPIGTKLRFDDTPIEYMGTTFRTGSIEHVYALKGYTRRPKDITDMQKLEPFIDKQKLEELKKHPNNNVELHNIEYEKKTNNSKTM